MADDRILLTITPKHRQHESPGVIGARLACARGALSAELRPVSGRLRKRAGG